MRMKRTLLTIAITLLAVTGLTACSETSGESTEESTGETDQAKSDNKGPVALVNGTELSRENFNTQLKSMKQQYSQMGMDIKGKEKQLKKSIVDQMIGTELLTQKAEEADINVSSEQVEKKYEEFTKRFKSEEQMNKAYSQNNTSAEKIKEQLKLQVKVDQYIKENTTTLEITEKELKEQYNSVKKKSKESKSFAEMKPQLKKQLTSQKQNQQVQKLVDELRKEAEVEVKI